MATCCRILRIVGAAQRSSAARIEVMRKRLMKYSTRDTKSTEVPTSSFPTPGVVDQMYPLHPQTEQFFEDLGEMQAEKSSHLKEYPLILGEPTRPEMKTSVPGPMSQKLKGELNKIQECWGVEFFGDYERSLGNYIVDADGNLMLDFFAQMATLPLGYNHPSVIEVYRNEDYLSTYINRPAIGLFPPREHMRRLNATLMSVAPRGMTNVYTTSNGTCAVEFGMKAMFMKYQRQRRGASYGTAEEMATATKNRPPGCPNLSILSFDHASHGRTMGALALSHNKWEHKIDLPQPEWPVADFPQLKFPLKEHKLENLQEEVRCLQMVQELINTYAAKGCPVAGIICEPVQGAGGDNFASPTFFQGLQDIAQRNDASLMLDEVETGCGATGRFWAHEYFYLREPPDVVAFGKKMQTSGIYLKEDLRPTEPMRIFSTWLGDPSKLLFLDAVIGVMKKEKLLDNAYAAGNYLLTELLSVQRQNPKILSRVRGLGLLIAFDLPTTEIRDQVVTRLRNYGVNTGTSGTTSIRLRPTLTIGRPHVDIFIDALRTVMKEMKEMKE